MRDTPALLARGGSAEAPPANSGSKIEEFATCGGRAPDKNRGGSAPIERNNIGKNRDTNDTRQAKRSSNKFKCHRAVEGTANQVSSGVEHADKPAEPTVDGRESDV